MKFTQETWQKIDSHFDKYLDSSPEEQQVFLNQKWENEEISRELKKLISALGKDDFFIENPAFKPVKHFFENETDEFADKKIGAYRLKKIIGRGVIRLWNIESGEQVLAFTASRKQITNLKFTADGKTLISFDASGKLSFWNGNY